MTWFVEAVQLFSRILEMMPPQGTSPPSVFEVASSGCRLRALGGGSEVPVEFIHSYLVYPGKGADSLPPIGGTTVPSEGKLFGLLNDIYSNSLNQCDIDIAFNASSAGTQQNPCRDLIIGYTDIHPIDFERHPSTALG